MNDKLDLKERIQIVVACATLLGVLGAPFLFLRDDRAMFASALVFLAFLACTPFIIVGARLRTTRRIVDASKALDQAELVRGPFGVVTHARGWLEGVPIIVHRKGVELDGPERKLLLGQKELRVLASDPGRLRSNLSEAIRLHRAGSLVRGAAAGATCPYCKDELAPREREGTIRCPACESVHHTACRQEHGGCSVFGCARVPGEGAPRVRG